MYRPSVTRPHLACSAARIAQSQSQSRISAWYDRSARNSNVWTTWALKRYRHSPQPSPRNNSAGSNARTPPGERENGWRVDSSAPIACSGFFSGLPSLRSPNHETPMNTTSSFGSSARPRPHAADRTERRDRRHRGMPARRPGPGRRLVFFASAPPRLRTLRMSAQRGSSGIDAGGSEASSTTIRSQFSQV